MLALGPAYCSCFAFSLSVNELIITIMAASLPGFLKSTCYVTVKPFACSNSSVDGDNTDITMDYAETTRKSSFIYNSTVSVEIAELYFCYPITLKISNIY